MSDIVDMAIPNGELRVVDTRPKPTDPMLSINNDEGRRLVLLRWNGSVEYDPGDLDEAARVFWDAVAAAPCRCGR